jgi:hypothetical protein
MASAFQKKQEDAKKEVEARNRIAAQKAAQGSPYFFFGSYFYLAFH